MKRWTGRILVTFSVVLLLCVCFLWVRSYVLYDSLGRKVRETVFDFGRETGFGVQSLNGKVRFHWVTNVKRPERTFWQVTNIAQADKDTDEDRARHLYAFGPPPPYYLRDANMSDDCQWHRFGFGFDHQPHPASPNMRYVLVVPYAAFVAFLLFPGIAALSRVGRSYHRRKSRRCIQCGYDLRASTESCPECGQRIPADYSQCCERNTSSFKAGDD